MWFMQNHRLKTLSKLNDSMMCFYYYYYLKLLVIVNHHKNYLESLPSNPKLSYVNASYVSIWSTYKRGQSTCMQLLYSEQVLLPQHLKQELTFLVSLDTSVCPTKILLILRQYAEIRNIGVAYTLFLSFKNKIMLTILPDLSTAFFTFP